MCQICAKVCATKSANKSSKNGHFCDTIRQAEIHGDSPWHNPAQFIPVPNTALALLLSMAADGSKRERIEGYSLM